MDAVEEVKARLSVEDVIGEYVELKRAGRNWRALSPWTNEKTASLMVSPDKQIWHDFSSGKGGNIFSFVMEMEGLDFKAALELLARKAGVNLEQYKNVRGRSSFDKERLYEANEAAVHFFQVQFSKNKLTLEYVLKTRQFTKETALEWRLGYSPTDGNELVNYLKTKKFSENEIKKAGLTNSYGKPMFRGRLMVPLADGQGRAVGFTARQLDADKKSPKYINTPSTVIYDKSRQVFGLHHAKDAIRKNNFVVLVEGNLDVIASHQAGIKNVVATAGTAMTAQHLKALARFCSDVRLAFDADEAGLSATERAIPIASKVGVNLSVISIPSGKDPDELIRRDAQSWRQAVEQPQYALDWLIEQYQQKLDLSSAKGKREFSDIILPVISQLTDKVEQDHYLKQVAAGAGITLAALQEKMLGGKIGQNIQPRRRRLDPVKLTDEEKSRSEKKKVEEYLLSILICRPKLISGIELINQEMLGSEETKQAWELIKSTGVDAEEVEQKLTDYGKMLRLEFEELYHGLEESELISEVRRLQARIIDQYVKSKKMKIISELGGEDGEQNHRLLTRAKELDELLKKAAKMGGKNAKEAKEKNR